MNKTGQEWTGWKEPHESDRCHQRERDIDTGLDQNDDPPTNGHPSTNGTPAPPTAQDMEGLQRLLVEVFSHLHSAVRQAARAPNAHSARGARRARPRIDSTLKNS